MKLELHRTSFSYEGAKAPVFQDVSLSAESGEIIAVLGQNGAGKTTLMKCLLGFYHFQSGTYRIDGADAASLPASAFWKMAAYVPQAGEQTFPLTVSEAVLLGRTAYLGLFGMPGARDMESAERAMRMAGILQIRDQRCDRLSGGQKQLVLIARALAAEPQLLFMDEPETGLDFRNQLVILQFMRKLAKENGLLILFNTHSPDNALRISDRTLLFLRDGTPLFGPSAEILTEERMRDAFGVEVREAETVYGGSHYVSFVPVDFAEREDHADDV